MLTNEPYCKVLSMLKI